ncbi:unnamed protein product [Ixodes persulcatus]
MRSRLAKPKLVSTTKLISCRNSSNLWTAHKTPSAFFSIWLYCCLALAVVRDAKGTAPPVAYQLDFKRGANQTPPPGGGAVPLVFLGRRRPVFALPSGGCFKGGQNTCLTPHSENWGGKHPPCPPGWYAHVLLAHQLVAPAGGPHPGRTS